MSIVNLKIIFVKKQKQTRERPTQGGGGTIHYNRDGRWVVCWGGGGCTQARLSSLKTANSGIPVSSVFNDSEGLYRNKTLCRCLVHCIGLIIPRSLSTGLWSSGELGRGKSEKASLPPFPFPFLAIFSPKQRACSQAIFRASNAFRVTWSEGGFSSDTPPKCLHRDCVGRRRTGTGHGNVYLSVREKQEIVVYRERVLQTVRSLGVLSLVFRRRQ